MVVRWRALPRLVVLAVVLGVSCTSAPPSLLASPPSSQAALTSSPSAFPIETAVGGLRPFGARMGAVDPLAASTQSASVTYAHVRLAATAAYVMIRFVNAVPQSIAVLDEATGSDLYHVSSQFGPGNPQVDQGFVQVFPAPLHADGSEQLVLAYGQCDQGVCPGASEIMVISMNAEHHVVIEQLRLDALTNAVAEARADGLWVTQWNGSTLSSARHFVWEDSSQEFVER
jgi:hypothetical protein